MDYIATMSMSVCLEYTTATWMPPAPTPKDRSPALVIRDILETKAFVQISMSVHLKHTTAMLTPTAPIQRDRFIALVIMDILVAVSRV